MGQLQVAFDFSPKQGAVMAPLLVRHGHFNYIPWAARDLEGLISRLPNIQDGAHSFIQAFEEETVSYLLACADIKTFLAKVLGKAGMEDILLESTMRDAVGNQENDAEMFNKYRTSVWEVLRAKYPARLKPGMLSGQQIGEDESAGGYLNRVRRIFDRHFQDGVEHNVALCSLFRECVRKGLPVQIQEKLKDVVGLASMSHAVFSDHIEHYVERFRQDKLRMEQQHNLARRKLVQMQLALEEDY